MAAFCHPKYLDPHHTEKVGWLVGIYSNVPDSSIKFKCNNCMFWTAFSVVISREQHTVIHYHSSNNFRCSVLNVDLKLNIEPKIGMREE